MIKGNWKEVDAVNEGEKRRLPAGGYVVRIKSVEDVPNKEYIRVEFDIAEGEWRGYYADLYERAHFWGGSFIRSYKESAKGFFKGFIEAVEKSNNTEIIREDGQIDERQLIGKQVGVILREEEYIGNDGSVKTRLKVDRTVTVDKIREGAFTVPDPKRLEGHAAAAEVIDTTQSIPESFEALNVELPF